MHPSPETLVLLALGERAGTTQERAHVVDCATCSFEVDDLAHLAGLGRTIEITDRLSTPAPEVWERIQAELAAPRGILAAPPRAERRVLGRAMAAGVALLLVGVGLGLGIDRLPGADESVIATATLTGLPAYAGAAGEAEVRVDADGRRFLVVDVRTPRPVGTEQQVWVLSTTQPGAMHSLGPFYENGQRFCLDGIDLAQFPLVDVSAEPDADPEHSGKSIVRGPLAW